MKKRDYALGARLKASMKAAGFKTAKEFCEKHHIPYLTFAQHIQGRRHPTAEFLQRYSKIFGVKIAWLKTGAGSPLSQSRSLSHRQQQKLKKAFATEMHKFRAQTSAMINTELLTLILEAAIPLQRRYHLSEKQCAALAANLYAQIIQTTAEPDLQKDLVSAFIKTYQAAVRA